MVNRVDTGVTDSLDNPNATCRSNVQESLELNLNKAVFQWNSSESDDRPLPIRFPWSESQIAIINAAYYVGYVPAIIPGTIITNRLGFFNYIALMLFSTCLLTGTFPTITCLMDIYGAVISRLLLGVVHGPATAAISGSWCYYWCLRKDITTTNSIFLIGFTLGTFTGGCVGGILLTVGYHWPTMYVLDKSLKNLT